MNHPYFKLCLFSVTTFFICTWIGISDYTADDVATWKRFDWFKLSIGIGAAMFNQILSFVDQSLSRWKDKRILPTAGEPVGAPTTVATQPADTGKT